MPLAERPLRHQPARAPAPGAGERGAREQVSGEWGALACLVLVGLGAGLSPFFSAYYSATTWVPIGLAVVVAAAIALVGRPPRLGPAAALTVGGVVGLGLWSLSSAAWAQSVESAVVDGNRMLVYGALLVLLLILLRSERRSTWLLGSVGVGVVAVGLSVVVRLLGSDPGSLFLNGRLNAPLGYINGEGCLFVMGFWLCWAVAERGRPAAAGAGAGAATLMGCLALLSQSRGTLLAMVASLLAVTMLAPGLRPRLFGLLLVAIGVALARAPLLAVYQHTVPTSAAHAAGRAAILSALGVGLVWAAALAAFRQLVCGRPARAARVRRIATAVLVTLALVSVIAAGAYAQGIAHTATSQWHAFTHLSEPADASIGSGASQSRLLSGAGNRYDYWRIAWNVWHGSPIIGVGAGNYAAPYFAQRATIEDVRQPHSLELQTLSELGLVGAAFLLVFVAGLMVGARRLRRDALGSARSRGLLVAGLGTSVAWFIQTSADWMHLLPGVTAAALAATAVLACSTRDHARPDRLHQDDPGASSGRRVGRRTATGLGIAGVALALAAGGASLSRQGLADLFRARAQQDVATSPSAALREADRSLSFAPDSVGTYYVKAAALARSNRALAARDALQMALTQEPDNFVTWALLGDIAVRRGQIGAARTDYSRAHALNPREPSLLALSVNPRAALP